MPESTAAFDVYRLFFGCDKPGGVELVSDEEWLPFFTNIVTPHFPDGLTVAGGEVSGAGVTN